MIARRLTPALQRSAKSLLLLGPRQTGKSTLVAQLEPDLTINLFHEPTYLEFARNPHELEERLAALPAGAQRRSIFIDEVQRLPSLLNTVQALLDRPRCPYRFLLTGSSAEPFTKSHTRRLVQHPKFRASHRIGRSTEPRSTSSSRQSARSGPSS